jgi:hypothetical protein
MSDRPLTDAQERVLVKLAPGRWENPEPKWLVLAHEFPGLQPRTWKRLRDLDLIERNGGHLRITPAGIALLDTMGD